MGRFLEIQSSGSLVVQSVYDVITFSVFQSRQLA